MARRFRRNHNDIEIRTRLDLSVMNIETMGKRERAALLQVRLDDVVVQAF